VFEVRQGVVGAFIYRTQSLIVSMAPPIRKVGLTIANGPDLPPTQSRLPVKKLSIVKLQLVTEAILAIAGQTDSLFLLRGTAKPYQLPSQASNDQQF